ncbi:hypothetical protein ASPZODRAFT_61916 [Penicilliopsis zonata CBS 506.65]|uniref:Uncharacterized protein n=1 Tax=Penicilliopsis zonata CBS 506.65 TaxID=1073090 RepID=A0A1L9SN71_9EURO|nr:hypothetical protein ASPZODRAFT_61916 [Penicilliopsis zonata CBS 506.65]OJJ48566.1 hypothetical protein ASPZODRAFT_61916 [Penicilliopsis zonata CBS 506.65]
MFTRRFIHPACLEQCPRQFFQSAFHQPSRSPAWRFFSNSPLSRAPKPSNASRKPTTTQKKHQDADEMTLKFAGKRPEGFGKLDRKVAKEGSVVLYRAPSHRSYILGAYGIAAFSFAYSIYNSNIVFRDPIMPLPTWQKTLFGGICIVMSVMGTVFLFKTGRLIKTVTAVYSNGQTQLNFSVRRIIPFMKPWEFTVMPRQLVISRRLVVHPDALRQTGTSTRPEDVTFFKAPLKKVSMALWKVFRSVRQIFTQEDFVMLEMQGLKGAFRMDSKGYLSEDFLAIGDPLSVKLPPRRQ